MASAFEETVGGLLGRWVDGARRLRWAVLAAAAALTVLMTLYTVENFGVNTDSTEMISADLQFRKDYRDYKDSYTRLRDPIVIVIEAATPDLAAIAGDRLVARIEQDDAHFEAINDVGGGPFFKRNGLLYLDVDELYDLGDRLAAAQPVLAELSLDMSLRGLFSILAEGAESIAAGDSAPDGELIPVFDALADAIEAELAGEPYWFSWQEIMSGQLASDSDRRRVVMVQPVQDFDKLLPTDAAIDAVRAIVTELGYDDGQGVRVSLTGSAVLAHEELSTTSEQAAIAGTLSFVLVALILFVGLRSPQVAIASLLTVFVGLIWTAAFATWAIGDFNLISIAFAVLFIGLGVDLAIHFGLRFREAFDGGSDARLALVGAGRDAGWALALCVVTDAIAFYAFVPTSYVGIAELGIIAGTGLFIAFFATMTVMPALLSLLPARPRPTTGATRRAMARVDATIRARAPAIVAVAAIVGIAAVFVSDDVRFDFDPINLRDPDTEGVRTFRRLEAESGQSSYTIKALASTLEEATALAERIEAQPTVDSAVTMASYVPGEQGEKLDIIDGIRLTMLPVLEPQVEPRPIPDNDARLAAVRALAAALEELVASGEAGPLADSAERLADALDRLAARSADDPLILEQLERNVLATLPYQLDRLTASLVPEPISVDTLPQEIRDLTLTEDGRMRIEIQPSVDASDPDLMERFVDEVRSVAPHATGGPVLIIESGRAIISAFVTATIIATIVISLLLLALLRSAVDTLLILVPLVLAGLLTLATTVLIGQAFNFANVIVLPLMIGLGVDSGIHMVMRGRAVADTAGSVMETSTPRAVVLSTLTTVASFGTLAVSTHQGMASMGILLMIAIGYTMVTTLIAIPALLSLKERYLART